MKSSPRCPVAEGFQIARLEVGTLDPSREMSKLVDRAAGNGAIVSFTGLARGQDGEVSHLVLEHHKVLTQRSLEEIAREARRMFPVSGIWVVHRCGRVQANRPIVFAAAVARHRRAAFEAADFLMDRLKTGAIFWKREKGPAGSQWVEPTEDDYEAARRWST